ncbi:hypothetical protein H489_0114200 [Curtobacterium flaccumfaciens UCD-AKU]|nr:hypothetical protein H489_0114200 [Curtobacterium flaccumfaciens UCD-AKU]
MWSFRWCRPGRCRVEWCTVDPTGGRRRRAFRPHPHLVGAGPSEHDGSALIGAERQRAGGIEHAEGRRGRVPVRVVRTDPDQPDARGEPPVELRVLVRRAVVRHLHDVDRPRRQSPGAPEPALRRLPQVTEEDPGQTHGAGTAVRRPGDQHDARVVAGVTAAGQGPGDPPDERPEGAGDPVVGGPDVHTRAPQVVDHPAVRRASDGSDQGGLDRVRHGSHRADVVAVEVRQDEQVDPADPEQVQARQEPFLVVAGVHEGNGVVAAEQHGVALPDVARGHRPVAGDGAAHHEHRDGDRCDTDHEHGPCGEQQPGADPAPDQHGRRDAAAHQHGGGHAEHSGRPRRRGVRQGGRPVRDAPDGSSGHPRDGRERLGTRRPHRCDGARGESDHRDDRRERLRQQVRRHRVGRERRRQWDRHGPARHLGRHGDRQCGGDRRPHTTRQQLGERWAEHHDAARGEHGQGERERPREPRVRHEHADRGECDERHAPHGSAGEVHDQHHDRHHRRPDDRGVGPHQDDERQEHHDGHRGPEPARQPAGAAEDDHQPDHHGAVRPGHRRQVRQRRGLHRRLGPRVEAGTVADRQPPQQCRPRLRQVGRGPDERLSGGVGGAEQPGGGLR